MDIVTDLTSQAISFLTLFQDIAKDKDLLHKSPGSGSNPVQYMPALRKEMALFKEYIAGMPSLNASGQGKKYKIYDHKRIDRVREIIFVSDMAVNEKKKHQATLHYILNNLLNWIEKLGEEGKPIYGENYAGITPIMLLPPDQWRRNIRGILYDYPQERRTLAEAIHYMPALIVLAFGEKEPKMQRKYQVFNAGEKYATLSSGDKNEICEWWSQVPVLPQDKALAEHFTGKKRSEIAEVLLINDRRFFDWIVEENPVSFEMMFNNELEQIERSRRNRLKDVKSDGVKGIAFESICLKKANFDEANDSCTKTPGKLNPQSPISIPLTFSDDIPHPIPPEGTIDPLRRAENMKLTALAFSGGGIRSATFNLGVIQKLAEKGILHHVDYLSTVSGGGYIGSWLLSWIQRSGSISKVTDRLDTNSSTDPMADEVRPLRWLRMYSNYLSPNAGIMSTDAWTIGITWVRNTLINQSILLLLLCTVLSGIEMVFKGWESLASDLEYNQQPTTITACILMLIGTGFATFGMRTFNKESPQKGLLKYGNNTNLAAALVIWAMLSAFFMSTWLFRVADDCLSLHRKLEIFTIPAIMAFVCLLIIAFAGNYHKQKRFRGSLLSAILVICGSSALAIAGTFLLMTTVWWFYELMRHSEDLHLIGSNALRRCLALVSRKDENVKTLAFTFGLPVVLEIMSLGVVFRMFIMGVFFPDERREWWGRTGALLHRFMLIWIAMTIAVFILPKLADKISGIKESEVEYFVGLLGGWAAIVGWGVKLAFGSTTSGENPEKTGLNAREIFIRMVPYLFMIGFLLIGSATFNYFQGLNPWEPETGLGRLGLSAINFLLLLLVTAFLSGRAGVNEFTLHHFYRNRLIRAYLGATRRRTERVKTANHFTGFDSEDDIALSEFSDPRYYGPYPLINTALNATVVSELDRQDRKAESFIFSPLFCGFDFSATRAAAYNKKDIANYGYRPTAQFAGAPTLGTAMAISGAAVNPNMGYHSSAATAFLLSVFNVKLGWWLGNPRTDKWRNPEPPQGLAYLVYDLVGKSDMNSSYVNLSDGGHFDNMGLYELVRRRCHQIILCDAEEDDASLCEGLAMAVRRCRIDFGVEIEIDTGDITNKDRDSRLCQAHVAVGKIIYPGEIKAGTLIYVKTALNGDESIDIREYKMLNPKFPQQPTSDQFFTEEQFESYRKLGYHSIE